MLILRRQYLNSLNKRPEYCNYECTSNVWALIWIIQPWELDLRTRVKNGGYWKSTSSTRVIKNFLLNLWNAVSGEIIGVSELLRLTSSNFCVSNIFSKLYIRIFYSITMIPKLGLLFKFTTARKCGRGWTLSLAKFKPCVRRSRWNLQL